MGQSGTSLKMSEITCRNALYNLSKGDPEQEDDKKPKEDIFITNVVNLLI